MKSYTHNESINDHNEAQSQMEWMTPRKMIMITWTDGVSYGKDKVSANLIVAIIVVVGGTYKNAQR